MSQTVEELRAEMLEERRWLLPKNPAVDAQGIARIDALIAAVIQAERRRILDASLFQFGMGDGTYMMIRTSVVDPKEDEKK